MDTDDDAKKRSLAEIKPTSRDTLSQSTSQSGREELEGILF